MTRAITLNARLTDVKTGYLESDMLRRILDTILSRKPAISANFRLMDGAPPPDSKSRLPYWQKQKNTLVFACTRVDSQYIIRETLTSGVQNPFHLITSRSRSHFEALFSTAQNFTHDFHAPGATLAPGEGYDPIADCRDDDEVIDNLNAFEPLGSFAAQMTRAALTWIRHQGLHPNLPILLRLFTSSGQVNPDSSLADPAPDVDVAKFRTEHAQDPDSSRLATAALTRFYDEINASLAHPWLATTDCLSPAARTVTLIDKGNRTHAFQLHGALRELVRREYDPARPAPIIIAEEADRFIAPALLKQLITSEKTRLVLIPEIAERILTADTTELFENNFGRFVWFLTHSGAGKILYDKLHGDRGGITGSAHDISCATLNLNSRIVRDNGVSTFEDLAASSGVVTREQQADFGPASPVRLKSTRAPF